MNLRKNSEAVSPVIGVILMVAITVVLAAVVFVLVTNLSGGVHKPQALSIAFKDSDHSFTVIESPDEPITYSQLTVKDNGVVASFKVNGAAPVGTATIAAGDLITLTTVGSGPHQVNFIYSDQVVYSKSFSA